jgi:hypothetical protein
MKMQLRKLGKIVGAGSLAMLMGASSFAFATLDSYPAPFVSGGTVQSLIVVGNLAAPSDVVGAIDIAARLGGESYTSVSSGGVAVSGSVVGEGKALDTTTTHVFLQDNLGKTGLRTTLTKDDLPTLLAKGTFADSDGTHKYDQFIDMTPGTTNANNVRLDFDKPGSSSSADPAYNFGRFTTSPSTNEYLYRTRVVFDVAVNGTNSIGKSLNLFGVDYTITSDTTSAFAGNTADKVVLFGSANVNTLNGGDEVTVNIGGVDYTIKLLGVTSANAAAIQVGSTTETVARLGTSTNFGDLKIYVKDAAQLSTTDQTQNYATLLIGADRITLQHGAKVKKGTNDDPVDGTYVELTTSSGKLNQISIKFGAKSSTNDFIAAGDATYTNQVFGTFGVSFPSMTPSVGGALDDKITLRNSGDNNLQITMTDFNSNTQTFNWGYKSTSSGTSVNLSDSSGNQIHVVENATVKRDEYIILDAGGFPHLFKVTSVTLDGSTSAGIDLQDVFTGATTKVTTGADNFEAAVLDGQTYYFTNVSSTEFNVNWGNNSGHNNSGTYLTVFPTLNGKNGELVAFARPNINITQLSNAVTVQLPTGAVTISNNATAGGVPALPTWTITAYPKEDGTASTATAISGTSNVTSVVFSLGRTATGAVRYNVSQSGASILLSVVGSSSGTASGRPNATVIIWEEKDDAGNQAGIIFEASTGASGSNFLAGIASPDMTGTSSGSQSWGSNTNKASFADLWGSVVVRDTATSAQPWVDLWYPDIQRIANVYVLSNAAAVGGTSGSGTVKSAVPITTALAKLDTEVSQSDRTNKHLILVGGPYVNSLVETLAGNGKTWTRAQWDAQGAGTAIVQLVSDAFVSGRSALVVSGYTAADTRTVTTVLQQYDTSANKAALSGKNLAVWKNGVISTALSA